MAFDLVCAEGSRVCCDVVPVFFVFEGKPVHRVVLFEDDFGIDAARGDFIGCARGGGFAASGLGAGLSGGAFGHWWSLQKLGHREV